MNVMAMRWQVLYRGTAAEHALEPAVAALGVPYRTQFPLYQYAGGLRYYPDFYLPTLKLVIEVDDPSHKEKAVDDARRTAELERVLGVKVYRVTNEEALRDNKAAVNRVMEAADLPHRVQSCLSTVEHLLPGLAPKRRRKRKPVRRVGRRAR